MFTAMILVCLQKIKNFHHTVEDWRIQLFSLCSVLLTTSFIGNIPRWRRVGHLTNDVLEAGSSRSAVIFSPSGGIKRHAWLRISLLVMKNELQLYFPERFGVHLLQNVSQNLKVPKHFNFLMFILLPFHQHQLRSIATHTNAYLAVVLSSSNWLGREWRDRKFSFHQTEK